MSREPTPDQPRRLLLLRHGQTSSNVAGALDTAAPGADLNDLGRRQAAAAARALVDEPLGGVYVSPLVRTQQTAAPAAEHHGLDAVVVPGLEEVGAGANEMGTDEAAITTYLDVLGAWLDGRLEERMPEGESGQEFLERYDAAVARLLDDAEPGRSQLLVSHGAAIRTWVTVTVDRAGDHPGAARLDNTGCITLEDDGSGWRVVDWHAEPLGGALLAADAPDPTGEAIDEPDPSD